jgi:hypothetical protein
MILPKSDHCSDLANLIDHQNPIFHLPRLRLMQSILYQTNLSHRSTTETTNISNQLPPAYLICAQIEPNPSNIGSGITVGSRWVQPLHNEFFFLPRNTRNFPREKFTDLPLEGQLGKLYIARQGSAVRSHK